MCSRLDGENSVVEDNEQFEKLERVLTGCQTKRDGREKGTCLRLLKNGYDDVIEAFYQRCRDEYLDFRRRLALASNLFHPSDPQHLSGCTEIYVYKVRLCAQAFSQYLFAGLSGCLSSRNTKLTFPKMKGGQSALYGYGASSREQAQSPQVSSPHCRTCRTNSIQEG